jgi:hypothetical protein
MFRIFIRILYGLFVFSILTVLTQVGGIVYLVSILTYPLIDKWAGSKLLRVPYRLFSFMLLYGLATLFIVPPLAALFGRVPLPRTATQQVQPLNLITCLLNRHYVRPVMRQTVLEAAAQMSKTFPGTIINYLDANFPFMDGFPLVPHLSHNDGEKLDLSFCYIDAQTGKPTNECPSWIGYGIGEAARHDEVNTTDLCKSKGYWQYSLLNEIIPAGNSDKFTFDPNKTAALVNFFASHNAIGKIFIEPHLKKRLDLNSNKIRFQGCQSVRHDDHIHIQL